jgi:putative transposase
MYVHLVFVTKYRRCVLDGEAIEKLRQIFSKVCTDFEALLAQIDGASNHVHLLVQYPPKVSVSSLVNSLKGVSSYVLRRQLPRVAKCTGRMRCGRLLTSPHPAAAHRSTQSNATSSSKRHHYSRGLPRPEFRGLRHSLVMMAIGYQRAGMKHNRLRCGNSQTAKGDLKGEFDA